MDGSIDEFFAAAFQPELWPTALDSLAIAAGARGATLVFGASTAASIAPSRSIATDVRDYFETNRADDPREARVQPTMATRFLTDFDFFTPREIESDPFYQEFLKPHDLGWHSVALLAANPVPVVLSIKRPHRDGPFESREVEVLDRALPYLRGAAAAAAVHAATPRMELAALAHLGIGAITLDRRGRALERNEAVTLGDGLSIIEGELHAAHRDDQPMLEAAIAEALDPAPPGERLPARRIVLRRPSGRRPLIVDVLPLLAAPARSLLAAAAMAVVTDLDVAALPEIADLRATFGLTMREAELAAQLTGGTPLEAAAARLRISAAHARQRLKTIFEKTDTHRQAELVAVLSRLRGRRR